MALGPCRIVAFLQGGRPRGFILPYKNAGFLFRESSAEERCDDGAEKREKRETNTIKMRGPKDAIVRSHNGEAQGRVDWKRDGWPDAKFEGTSAKCDL